MEPIQRAFTRRVALTVIIFPLMLLPMVASDSAWADGADHPSPLADEMTYRMIVDSKYASKGLTLIAPHMSNKVTLIDHEGVVVHTWNCNRNAVGTTLLLEDGTLLRGVSGSSGQPNGIQLVDWDGSVLWSYSPTSGYGYHHDIAPLPNGNILINAAITYTSIEAIDLGRDPSNTPASLVVDVILEIEPSGTSGGDVVWMWNPLDHLVQDYSSEMPNYGVVKDHPELIDFNYPPDSMADWLHSNAVAYNAELDQVMITNLHFSEIWVVDHNTTMEEAAGHTGGAHGRGGDLLYRWGNPQAYDAGDAGDQVIYGGHNGHWIGPGLPGEGNILVFNNGINSYMTRPEGKISTIEELVPPINATGGYDLVPGTAYGPSGPTWRYTASTPTNFFASAMGGVERLPDGNTLVCGGSSGQNFEVETDGDVVWKYRSNAIFRVTRYYPPSIDLDHELTATEDVPLSVDLSPYLTDPDTDHDDLMIETGSPYARVAGHELQLQYPDGMPTEFVNITVSDGVFAVEREVLVNITQVNDPPIIRPISDIAATEDVPHLLDLRPYVLDPDNGFDQLTITVDSSFVTVEGFRLRFLYPDGVLADRVVLSVSDGEYVNRTEMLVSVTPVNDPPTVDRIQDQQGLEDVPWTLDLGRYIRDIDTPMGSITVASDSRYARASGLSLLLQYPEGVTREAVSLTVSDGASRTFARFNVTVAPVNDPPAIGDVPPLNIKEDDLVFLDLGPAVSDIDTPVERLTLRVESPFIEAGGLVLSIRYPDGVLRDEVVIELSDGDLRASTTLVVIIEPVNDPPVFGRIPPLTLEEDATSSLDLGPAISDIDTPMGGLTISVDSPFVEVRGHILDLLYPEGVLHDELTLDLWDGEYHASTTLVVNVEPVNDPPWWAPMPDIIAVEEVEGQLDLRPYMRDVDTPPGQLGVEAASSHGSVEGGVLTFLYPDGVLGETVTLTLTDGENRAVLRLNVTVTPLNDAPELSGALVDPPEGRAGTPFTFTVVFRDVDIGSHDPVVEVVVDGVRYRCPRDEPSAGSYTEGAVFSLEMDLGPGVHKYHFIADDGDGGVVTTEASSVAVDEVPDRTSLPGITTVALIIVVVVLVATLLMKRMKRSLPPA